MTFYLCQDETGTIFDCTQTLKEAKQIVGAYGQGRVLRVDFDITAKNVMNLLGNIGSDFSVSWRPRRISQEVNHG